MLKKYCEPALIAKVPTPLKFSKRPYDYTNNERGFRSWIKDTEENFWYQGEVDGDTKFCDG
jgi:hypothetical protein